MFKDYEILKDSDIKNLEAQVKRKIQKGWVPISEITVATILNQGYNEYFIQVAEIDPAQIQNFTNIP